MGAFTYGLVTFGSFVCHFDEIEIYFIGLAQYVIALLSISMNVVSRILETKNFHKILFKFLSGFVSTACVCENLAKCDVFRSSCFFVFDFYFIFFLKMFFRI